MKELYINNRLVDLREKDNPIALTFAVNNLAELKDRQANFSNIFKCPATENNREIFGYADSDSFTQDEPYKILPAKLIQNGIEIVPNGIAIIQSAGANFEVQVLSGVKGFMTLIGDKTLQDLDLSDFDHVWNLSRVSVSQFYTAGYKYPVIDYGQIGSSTIDARHLRPAVFNKTIITKIIEEAGYSFEGEVFEDAKFVKELIPFALDKFEHAQRYIDSIPSYDFESVDSQYQATKNLRDFIVEMSPKSDPSSSYSNNEYTVKIPMKATVKLVYWGYADDEFSGGAAPSVTYKLQLIRDGVITDLGTNTHVVDNGSRIFFGSPGDLEGNPNLEAVLDLYPGDKIRVAGRHEPGVDRIDSYISPLLTLTYDKKPVIFGQPVQLEATLPKISQKDYLKDFMQRYCLTPVVDNYKNKITFKSFSELYRNKAIARDWTDKFISIKEDARFTLGNYAQLNWGKYKEDELVPEELGAGSFAVANETLKSEHDLFTSVFAATEMISKLGKNFSFIKKIENAQQSMEFKVKSAPRILIDKSVPLELSFTDGATINPYSSASIPTFEGLEFSDLFQKNYFELINYMLPKVRVVTRYVKLDETDIANLDHFIPVYDANEAKYYYLNQIKDYIEGEPAQCEFIRM